MKIRICNVEDCTRKHRSNGYCNKHSQAFKKYGDPEYKVPNKKDNETCTVEGCTEPYKALGLCRNHYQSYKNGNTSITPAASVRKTVEKFCTVEGCENIHYSKGMCRMHKGRFDRTGNTDKGPYGRPSKWAGMDCECGKPVKSMGKCSSCYQRDYFHSLDTHRPQVRLASRKETPSYITAHHRVRYAKGPASSHQCVDCDNQAQDWSLEHGKGELVGNNGKYQGRRYSADPENYSPRCKPCHGRYDSGENRNKTMKPGPKPKRDAA